MYSPLIVMLSMVVFVFLSYAINYIGMYVHAGKPADTMRKDVSGVVYNKFVIEEVFDSCCMQIHYCLLAVITWNTFWLLFSIIKAAMVNPGYLPSPIEMEFNYLVNNNYNNDNTNHTANALCLAKFYMQSQNGPLTEYERSVIMDSISKHCNTSDVDMNACTNNTSLTSDCIVDRKDKSSVMLCAYCIRWKPERCHHCRKCNKCVLKMDHHCPWLVNCVGFNNYKYFVLSIIYGSVNTMLITLTYSEYVIAINLSTTFSVSFCVWNTFAFMCNFLLMCFVCYLLCVNVRRVLMNVTSIEHAERLKASFENDSSTKEVSYNRGIYLNITEVLGDNPLLWLLPFNAHQTGNGIVFNNNTTTSSSKRC